MFEICAIFSPWSQNRRSIAPKVIQLSGNDSSLPITDSLKYICPVPACTTWSVRTQGLHNLGISSVLVKSNLFDRNISSRTFFENLNSFLQCPSPRLTQKYDFVDVPLICGFLIRSLITFALASPRLSTATQATPGAEPL